MSNKSEAKDSIEFKIITLGDSGVGKTSIIKRYVYNKFEYNSINTIGISYSFKDVILPNGQKIQLKLIDTAGQEKYRSLSKSYFKHANGVFFIFSLNDPLTFQNIEQWVKDFNENKEDSKVICQYLIGNKNDLEINVDQELIEELKEKCNIKDYKPTSAKENTNIGNIFDEMSQILYDNYSKKKKTNQKNLELVKHKPEKKGCCLQQGDV